MTSPETAAVNQNGNVAPREHFIPLRKADLVDLLAEDSGLDALNREKFRALCRLLEATLHYEYHERLENLKNAYAGLDPDSDTCLATPPSEEAREQAVDDLCNHLVSLLERANYRHLSREAIEQVLDVSSGWGVRLDVDFEVFDRLEVYARGDQVVTQTRRLWWKFFKTEETDVPVYQRLVVIFRLREHPRLPKHVDPNTVYIKMFKNIPKADLEMLLPGSRVKMTMLDRGKIVLPTATGVGVSVFKIINGALLIGISTLAGILSFLAVTVGMIGYGIKSFFGFLRTKEKYQLNLTRNLYYQNLDNNAGVLFHLLDDAEEQEFREAILAYFLLWRRAPEKGWTLNRLDREAETLIRGATNVDVDFEVDDAVEKLKRFKLVESDPGGLLRAVPIREALASLDEAWDNYFPHSNAQSSIPKPHAERLSVRKSAAG